MVHFSNLLIPFDYNLLNSYYLGGATFSAETQRAMANAAGVKQWGPAVIAPWQLVQTTTPSISDQILNILGTVKAFDLDDPGLDRLGVDDDFRKLFALYNGLGMMAELAELAESGRVPGVSRSVLQRKLEGMQTELTEFLRDNTIEGLTFIEGLKLEEVVTEAFSPSAFPDRRIEGGVISDTYTQDISGISAQTFYMDVTRSGVLHTVTIDLSQVAGTKSIENIITYINNQLIAEGLSSTIGLNQISETEFGMYIMQEASETISFRSDPATEGPAVYIAGNTGFDIYGQAFIRKFYDVATAEASEDYFKEFGVEGALETAQGVAVDSEGNVYIVGVTEGDMDGQVNLGGQDIFLTKYDSVGNELFTRFLGSSTATTSAFDIVVDSKDNVIIAGSVVGELTLSSYGGGIDGFIAKFDKYGQEIFVHQQAPTGTDATVALAIDADDNIIIGGYVATNTGNGADSSLITLDSDGNMVTDKVSGTLSDSRIIDMAITASGNTLVLSDAGGTIRSTEYNGTTIVFSNDLGSVGTDGKITGLSIDDSGIYITGTTSVDTLSGSRVGSAHNGGLDAFVLKADLDGTAQNYTFLGTSADEQGTGIAVYNGEIFITGSTTGLLGGTQIWGSQDGYLAKFDSSLTLQYVEQFRGSFGIGAGTAIAINPVGSSILSQLGLPTGDLPQPESLSVTANTSVRESQQFSISVNGGLARRVTIDLDQSFGSLVARINTILGTKGRAKLITTGEDGERALRIEAKNGSVIEIFSGPDGRDALLGLGLKPATLYGEDALGQDNSLSDSVFALGLIAEFSLLDTDDATDLGILLRSAQTKVKKAFQYFTGTEPDLPLNLGAPSAYLLSRIANMREGLLRLTGGNEWTI